MFKKKPPSVTGQHTKNNIGKIIGTNTMRLNFFKYLKI